MAQCSREHSDISPLTNADIAFSTLEGRPSAENFEDSPVLQDWVTATEIRIVLNRLNTFGDEVFRDEKVLRSYYYAISDLAVGGRCKCNGHARECVKSTGQGQQDRLVCRCEHNTQGADCQQCLPFYNDRPWRSATSLDANECKPCNCSDLSNRCYFDEDLFETTGSGGHCIDCTGNTEGVHCEKCAVDHWRRPSEHYCVPCGCDPLGSLNLQCDHQGQCPCKPGVEGQFCDRCQPGFFHFGTNGCKDCNCDSAGSLSSLRSCHADTGECMCKENVEGKQCDRCKPGYFDKSADNEFGCSPCFCYGHSSVCESAPDYYAVNVSSQFRTSKEKWRAESGGRPVAVQWAEVDRAAATSDQDGSAVYFLAPQPFLGDRRAVYSQHLVFQLRLHRPDARPSRQDVVLVGVSGQELSIPIFAQGNPHPSTEEQTYKFRIHANQQFQWSPRLSELDFIGVLSNLTALKIRGTYSPEDVGFLNWVKLGSASRQPSSSSSPTSSWVESCSCLEGFVGQFCESCAPGYRRERKFGGSFNRCIKCDCHGHSESCHAESGACICDDDTAGDTCERCRRGYYGNALQGTNSDCEKCPCPEEGPCILHSDGDIICTECPVGYSGRRCDTCADGFFGALESEQPCTACECNGNIDQNSIGNCDSSTGECLKCIHHTRGYNCEQCKLGFWGDALLQPGGDCSPCRCFPPSTWKPSIDYEILECGQKNGQCDCMDHVTGAQCDQCEPGYFNLISGSGCKQCNCDALGSLNASCHVETGQCLCKVGVVGKRCDQCADRSFGFGSEGCKACDCEIGGSSNLQCDVITGQCPCRPHIESRRCDRCSENMYDLSRGCLQCDQCYTLIQSRVAEFRRDVGQLRTILNDIIDNPVHVNDTDFDGRLEIASGDVEALGILVEEKLAGDDSQMLGQVEQLRNDLEMASKLIETVDETIARVDGKAEHIDSMLLRWKMVKDHAFDQLTRVRTYLETEGRTQWELAKETAQRYGKQSQQLSELAQEARKLADKHENRSLAIVKSADMSINASETALNEAKEAIFGGEATSKQIAYLETKLKSAENVYNQTAQLAEEQLKMARESNQLAAEILTTVESRKLPSVNTEKLESRAAAIGEEAGIAGENVREQAANNKGILDQARLVADRGRHRLQEAEMAQQEADSMLADVDAAKSKALEAVALAENTLKEADDTLQTLIDFNKLVEESKEKANKELEKVADIERKIEIVENRTLQAENELGNARSDAKSAEEIAVQAEKDAVDASKAAEELKKTTMTAKEMASNMEMKAEELAGQVGEVADTLDNYNKQAGTDHAKADEAVTAAVKAENTAKMSNKTIAEAAEKVERIIDQLNSLDTVSEIELDELEEQLEEATKTLEEASLADELANLKEAQTNQQRKIGQYKTDIDKLMEEVGNIEQIRDSLPKTCFNVVNLEQEGQK